MALKITAQGNEPLPTGEYRVELTAIELEDTPYGEQLKWTFHVLDKGRNLTAYSSLSASLASKCMRWASALLGRPVQAGEQVDFEALVGKTARAVVVRVPKDDGREINKVENLLFDNANTTNANG